jgi:predicted flap endonuclease-1-like 5' DNA nuclease
MLYLATQFAWFLLAAFALGLVMGWISHDGGKLWNRKLSYLLGVWLVVAALTWSQTLNGVPALWLESALLFVAIYVAGCALASVLRSARGPRATEEAASRDFGEMPKLDMPKLGGANVAPVSMPGDATLILSAKPLVDDSKTDGGKTDGGKTDSGKTDSGKTVLKGIKSIREANKGVPKVEGEDAIPGERPVGIAAARSEGPDDLKLIKGIGRQNEGRLHGLGIWHFDQIAAWSAQNIEWVGSYLAFPGRIEREDWVSQAKALAQGAETAFAKRVKAGEVSSSHDDGSHGQGNVAPLSDDGFEGERPKNLLTQARDGKADDLTLIKGIGPAIAADLNRLGIWHFDQIAALRDPEMRYISAFAGVPGKGSAENRLAENWREDADILSHGGETAHSRAVKAGRTSPGT